MRCIVLGRESEVNEVSKTRSVATTDWRVPYVHPKIVENYAEPLKPRQAGFQGFATLRRSYPSYFLVTPC
jgi:hypothetical protein